ncbi:hypothetical protein PoB_006290700 [Plakobranchus ocellatus]|uniref:Uncharacterized protein n=1 Tax=Plakobranchus ocellatus TaxID=259542 RepID=A0AAV4CWW0_9GAST|nr:hypothetical protein PoB_006290700 [Plakobranchus ocellatus]
MLLLVPTTGSDFTYTLLLLRPCDLANLLFTLRQSALHRFRFATVFCKYSGRACVRIATAGKTRLSKWANTCRSVSAVSSLTAKNTARVKISAASLPGMLSWCACSVWSSVSLNTFLLTLRKFYSNLLSRHCAGPPTVVDYERRQMIGAEDSEYHNCRGGLSKIHSNQSNIRAKQISSRMKIDGLGSQRYKRGQIRPFIRSTSHSPIASLFS